MCNKMINGLNLSQIYSVQHKHLNHYQKLDYIVNHQRNHFQLMSKNLEKVIENHKNIHENWRMYKNKKHNTQIKRDNDAYHKKIASIKMRKSRYNVKQSQPLLTSKGHNFYIRKKRDLSIQIQNPEIANRIINAQGSLSLMKCQMQGSQRLANQLQKFQRMKRMIEYSGKKLLTDVNQYLSLEEKVRPHSLNRNHRSAKQCKPLK